MKQLFLILLIIFFSWNLNAKQTYNKQKNKNIEDWYFNLALGLGNTSYDRTNQEIINELKNVGIDNIVVGIDIGLYLPILNNKGLIGGVINGVGDRFEDSSGWLQLNQYLIGPSLKYYFNDIGKGLYSRCDLGIAYASIDASFGHSSSTENGWGYLIGIGWAIPLNNQTRVQLLIDYTSKSAENQQFNALLFNIGFLF